MLSRAYSVLDIKSVDSEQRIITGIASTPESDRIGDVMNPKGAQFQLPMPLLWQHKQDQPIGEVFDATVTDHGIEIKARIAKMDAPGQLKDRLDLAWQSIATKLVRGLSIGFKPIEEVYNKARGGFDYPKWAWYELSAVTIPMNASATIQNVKSFDVHEKAAIPPHSTATTSVAWDGPAAKSNLKNDAGAATFRKAFAWVDGKADADLKGSYKFIHHEVSSDGSVGAANTTACSSGIAVLNGAREGTTIPESDRAGVYAHLAQHLKDAGLTPPTLKALAALGQPSDNPAGVSASSRTGVRLRTERPMKKSYADMIADCVASRKEKTDRIDALLTKSGEAGVTLDEAESEQHDTLAAEVVEIDKQLARYRAAEAREKAAVVPVRPTGGLEVHSGAAITITDPIKQLPPGTMFARYAMCMAMARGNEYTAIQIAKDAYGDNSHAIVKLIELQQKTAVGAANAQTAGWASELVPYNLMDDFITYLRPRTILGKFGTTQNGVTYPSLRRVPFNTRVSGFNAGTTANWVGEGLPVLMSKATSFTTSLTWSKIGALVGLTKEEMRFSNPSAEAKVRDDIAASVITKQDKDFIDPSKAASANVSPASVTYQTVPVLTTGTTATQFRTDFATLLATFATALLSPEDIVIIMSTGQALNISLMLSSLGVPFFPSITMSGGYLLGFPVITTTAMTSIGSPVSEILVAVKAGEIYLADDGVVTIDASDQASVEMVDSSSQTGISGTGASLVSAFQSGLLFLKATREINWKLRRTGAARYIYNVAYKA